MSIDTILPYVTLGSAVLMIIALLLQQRGASLGAGLTIVFAVIFVLSILASMILPGLQK